MSGSVYTCKNHRELRWFDTKPGGKLVFLGEIQADDSIKPAAMTVIPPYTHLKHAMNGRNPFAPELETESPITTWEGVLDFVAYIKEQSQTHAFECQCPGSDLVKVTDEDADELLRRKYA